MLPIIIFILLFKASSNLAGQSTKIIFMILVLVCVSNFFSTYLSHFVGSIVYNFNLSLIQYSTENSLCAKWNFHLPRIIPNNIAMFLGIILGILGSITCKKLTNKISHIGEKFSNYFFKILCFVIPFFILGFVCKLQYDGSINVIIKEYGIIFTFIFLAQFAYIISLYIVLSGGNLKEALSNINNLIPASISAFSTMSSAASMPLTIIGVDANSKNKEISHSVIPATVNIHLIGDCFAIPIFAYAVLKSFGVAEPSVINYLIFSFYFVLAKFSVAAVPGGGILVMLPILESNLNFHGEMLPLITSLYILFDPVITMANVLGNGAFAKLIDKIISFYNKPNAV